MLFHQLSRRPPISWMIPIALVLLATVGSSADNTSDPRIEQCASGVASDDGTCATDQDFAGHDDPSCIDQHEKCPLWTRQGECVANPGYMLESCKKSCKVCGNVEESDDQLCEDEDLEGSVTCSDILQRELCETELTRCRKTCGACVQSTADFGPEQQAEGEADAVARTRAIIRESIAYMRDIRQNRENKKIAHCENTHELCSFWAGIGECKENSKYMNTECAPACQTCWLIDINARCPMDPDAVDALYPGDLNRMFERFTGEDSEFADYKPTVLSRPLKDGETDPVDYQEGPWVVTFENFVSDDEIERLLFHGNNTGYERSSDVGKVKHDGSHDSLVSDSRTSENAWCSADCKTDPIVDKLIKRIAWLTDTPRENSEDLQLLRYEPGQYYVEHHDYIEHQLERPCGVRILTLFLYLNDVEEGGETSFPRLDMFVTPKKGKALLWPSVLDEDPNKKDGRTDHEAISVKKGIKFGANAWIHMRDFQAAMEMNCHN